MTRNEVVATLVRNEPIVCTRYEYVREVRDILRTLASVWLLGNDVTNAWRAQSERQRLDLEFNYNIAQGDEGDEG